MSEPRGSVRDSSLQDRKAPEICLLRTGQPRFTNVVRTRSGSHHAPARRRLILRQPCPPAHSPNAYIYGPVCVAADERVQGLASALFAALLARVPDRECFTFIRGDNTASLRAHAKMGMRTVATFTLGDVDYVVVAYGVERLKRVALVTTE
jgi:GNAT superfamily N-acetyltransferase